MHGRINLLLQFYGHFRLKLIIMKIRHVSVLMLACKSIDCVYVWPVKACVYRPLYYDCDVADGETILIFAVFDRGVIALALTPLGKP